MTAQTPDILLCRGQRFDLCAKPLEDYLRRLPKARRPRFIGLSTANYCGYIATWEICDGQLRLVALEGHVEEGHFYVPVTLEQALPWVKGSLHARWVTDTLRCPEGRLLCYAHRGFASSYARDRLFQFRKGQLEEEWLQVNPPEPLLYRIRPDGTRVCFDEVAYREIADPLEGDDLDNAWKVWGKPPEPEAVEEGYMVGAALIYRPV